MSEDSEIINVVLTDGTELINIQITDSGPQGPQGAAGTEDPNSHQHVDPKAITRVIAYVPEYKAYEIVET